MLNPNMLVFVSFLGIFSDSFVEKYLYSLSKPPLALITRVLKLLRFYNIHIPSLRGFVFYFSLFPEYLLIFCSKYLLAKRLKMFISKKDFYSKFSYTTWRQTYISAVLSEKVSPSSSNIPLHFLHRYKWLSQVRKSLHDKVC